MSEGVLYKLRKAWVANGKGFFADPYDRFVREKGAKAQFMHIGLDSEKMGARTFYHAQPYAVFMTEGSRVAFTRDDLIGLTAALIRDVPSAVRENMTRQLKLADYNYKANQALAEQLAVIPGRQPVRRPA